MDNIGVKIKIDLGAISFFITLVFFLLKVTGVVNWSWGIIFLPIIIDLGLVIIGFWIAFIILSIVFISDKFAAEKEHRDCIAELKNKE